MLESEAAKSSGFSPLNDLLLFDWSRIEYKKAWQKQKELLELRIRDEISDCLIFCEHDPVITLGRASQRKDAPAEIYPKHLETVAIERGGQATYHGPGQIVVYPIAKMASPESAPYAAAGILGLIRSMENWVIAFLKSEGLDALSIPNKTGVWVKADMMAAVGYKRLDFISLGKDRAGKRIYCFTPVSAQNLKAIRASVLAGLGLSQLTKNL